MLPTNGLEKGIKTKLREESASLTLEVSLRQVVV